MIVQLGIKVIIPGKYELFSFSQLNKILLINKNICINILNYIYIKYLINNYKYYIP